MITFRTHIKTGDMDRIINMHEMVYSSEFHYNHHFLGYVTEGLDDFILQYNPGADGIWLAEDNGKVIGSVIIIGRSGKAAQLRYFILLPEYRGKGIGKELMQYAVDFCKSKGYHLIYLWTTQELETAAALYKQFGFVKTRQVRSDNWGKQVVEECYDLILQ